MHARPDIAEEPEVASADPAPRFAFPVGGDDIARAQGFCSAARRHMDRIIDAPRELGDSPGSETQTLRGRDPHWLCEELTAIQQGAKRARARAVYRGVQDVMGLIHCNGPHMPIDWGQVDGRLLCLNKLLTLYVQGLREVEDACRVTPIRPASKPAPMRDGENDNQAFADARDTLRSLLPHARDAERALLQTLMDAASPEPVEPAEPLFALEDVLPDLTQRLLGHGRDYGKTLSVSYALDGVALPEAARDALASKLWDVLAPLVAASLPLQGVGHLDIADRDGALHVSGSGFAAFDLDYAGAPAARDDAPTPPRKPLITPDTEDALRAQLAALLDGGS